MAYLMLGLLPLVPMVMIVMPTVMVKMLGLVVLEEAQDMNSKWTSESFDCSYYNDGINYMIFLFFLYCFITHI